MSDEHKPFHNPFASLAHLRGRDVEKPAGLPAPGPPTPAPLPDSRARPAVARAVVRMQRAGRGGKEVTVIEHLRLPAAELEVWLKGLKSSLGCGGVVEGDAIVLQGDQRPRLSVLLSARGVKRVTVA